MARTQRRRSATPTSDAPAASGEPSRRRRDNLPRPAAELKKVTWPSWDETRPLTIVVSIVATVVGVSLGLIDLGFGWVIEKLLF